HIACEQSQNDDKKYGGSDEARNRSQSQEIDVAPLRRLDASAHEPDCANDESGNCRRDSGTTCSHGDGPHFSRRLI
ncbi:hypothetical protein, partial [Pseudomonas sp. RTS4]|uniref:hypothetical protein n=1 Tax=Pseudomonas sp. RTS4 TaxID=3048644 RepID=UPI002B226F2D